MPDSDFFAPQILREDDPFIELVVDYLDGALGADQFAELSRILHTDEFQRRKFVLICAQHQMLRKIKQAALLKA